MSLSIKIKIANRTYPMTINRESEESVRKSVKKIAERIKFYETNYAINDRQDLLAMCLIEVASRLESLDLEVNSDNKDIELKLENIHKSLSSIV
ncbi:MAG: cell division protein ZapA [Flavobacteriales bacterium]|nr:cell division protein ZapA [Flavobacteriales bacterium]|tara:strand:- start:753 stop:1034 length:282 start_codon:yes stop_codon:yes gene_type:complete